MCNGMLQKLTELWFAAFALCTAVIIGGLIL